MFHFHDLYRRNTQEIETDSWFQRAFSHRLADEMIQQDERAFSRHTGSDQFG